MAEKQGQFQIVVLEPETQAYSHSLPGPWGQGITSSVPTDSSSLASWLAIPIKVLPRPNERSVDPSTLKASHQ